MEAAFKAHPLWAGCSDDELESAGEVSFFHILIFIYYYYDYLKLKIFNLIVINQLAYLLY